MRGIEMPAGIYEQMIGHALSGRPMEVCGILAGKGSLAECIYQGRNVDASAVSYELDPRQQLEIERQIKRDGRKMLSIYHSHPSGPAYPSPKDVSLAFWDVVYLIIGLAGANPDVRAFIIEDGAVREVPIKTV
ncbi:MAG: M67 family metallopeptidase [Nitrospiraceae bacterium]|nr:M67 family metallopeptidase [Nitrospiraceae bacterium]